MTTNFGSLEASLQEKIDADTDFNASIATLSDEEKTAAITTKKTELFEQEVSELKKQKEIADNQKTRAEKAESELKKVKPAGAAATATTTEEKKDLTSKDLLAIMGAKVDEEDIDTAVNYARFNNVTVAEALKSDELKAILGVRVEKRNTAAATNTGSGRRPAIKPTGDALVEKANQGQLPDSDDDIAALMAARAKRRD